jgi:hypothetical protein
VRVFAALLLLAPIPEGLHFEKWFTSHGVEVEIARQPGAAPWVLGRAELPVPAAAVAKILTDYADYQEIFAPGVKSVRILDVAPDGATRLHIVWPYPFPLRNRDAVIRYRGHADEEGRFVLSWEADGRGGDPHEGVRITRVAGETSVEPAGESRCRVTYTYLGELGGNFPASAEEKAWRAEPVQYIRALRRRLHLPDVAEGSAPR